jgi:hypothetical protein
MKLAILGDLHLGIRDDDLWIQNYQKKFFEFFFDECKDRGIVDVLQLGDWFDVRRGATQETMQFMREYMQGKLENMNTTALCGNHDMHLRESITPNSIREILGNLSYVNCIEKPTTITFGNLNIDVIPWICDENQAEIYEFIDNSESEYCVGHFELNGYFFAKGQKSSGSDATFLKKYKQVWSGHFHTQSEAGNVKYLGTPYTLTLADADDKRGFWIFDTETLDMQFVENPDCWHTKLYYNADVFDLKNIETYANKSVKIIVEKRSSDSQPVSFDVIEDRISHIAHKCQTLDEIDLIEHVSTDIKSIKDIGDYVLEYVNTLNEIDDVKEKTNKIFNTLHAEARYIS